jgi:hypothetical protein
MLKLYGFSKVNAVARGHTRDLRVLWALKEMQLPFERAGMDQRQLNDQTLTSSGRPRPPKPGTASGRPL